MQDEELVNVDILSAQFIEIEELMLQGKVVFIMTGGHIGPEISELDPDIKIGTLPVPAIHEGDVQSWIGGERQTVALWKDSEHKEEARKFIEYLASEDVARRIAEVTNLPPGLVNVDASNYYDEYYELYADVKVQPYFDRVLLPSGMWDVMGNTAQELLAETMSPEDVSKEMGEEYLRLRDQAEED